MSERPVVMDPRLIDAVVDFTGEVATVAADLAADGTCRQHGDRLAAALDRLNSEARG